MSTPELPIELFGTVFDNLEVSELEPIRRVCRNWSKFAWQTRKAIDISSSKNYKAKIIDLAMIGILKKTKQLTSLNLSDSYFLTADTLKTIGELGLPLRTLILNGAFALMGSNTQEANVNISHLKTITSLTDLQLKWHRFGDEGMATFENMINMTNLDLTGCEMKGAGFKYLLKMNKLKKLYFSFSPTVTDEAFPHVAQITSLDTLELQYCDHITDEGTAKLANLKDLIRINFHGCKITDKTIDMIVRSMPKMVQLHLSDCANLTNKSIEMIKNLKNLTGLYMYRCETITADGWSMLSSIVDLRELYLNRTKVDDRTLENLGGLVHLRRLHFGVGEPVVTDKGVAHLANLNALEWLDASNCRHLTNKAVETIGKLSNLKRLRLSKCATLDDNSIPHLEKLKKLIELDVSETAMTKDTVRQKFKWVKSLKV